MQEEGVVARDRTMRYLANVLRSYDRSIPFEVPQLTADQVLFYDIFISGYFKRKVLILLAFLEDFVQVHTSLLSKS